jgi:carbohydrate-binding DOMON domain-containing protein
MCCSSQVMLAQYSVLNTQVLLAQNSGVAVRSNSVRMAFAENECLPLRACAGNECLQACAKRKLLAGMSLGIEPLHVVMHTHTHIHTRTHTQNTHTHKHTHTNTNTHTNSQSQMAAHACARFRRAWQWRTCWSFWKLQRQRPTTDWP